MFLGDFSKTLEFLKIYLESNIILDHFNAFISSFLLFFSVLQRIFWKNRFHETIFTLYD